MLRRLALVRADVSEALSSSETSVLTRATRRNIPEDPILQTYNLLIKHEILPTQPIVMHMELCQCEPNVAVFKSINLYNCTIQIEILQFLPPSPLYNFPIWKTSKPIYHTIITAWIAIGTDKINGLQNVCTAYQYVIACRQQAKSTLFHDLECRDLQVKCSGCWTSFVDICFLERCTVYI
jgi:hypothetical protein